ncbi:MAG: hypothetical protein ACPGOV_05685 [Magnetovibrionaceae bacterium]
MNADLTQDLAFATKGLDVAQAEITAIREEFSRIAAEVTAVASEKSAQIAQALQGEDLLNQRLDGVLTLIAASQAAISPPKTDIAVPEERIDALLEVLLLEAQRRDVAHAFGRALPPTEDDSAPGEIDLF